MSDRDAWMDELDGIDDSLDPVDDALPPYWATTAKRRQSLGSAPMPVAFPVGDWHQIRAPGEAFAITLRPQVMLRIRRLKLTQFVDGRSESCRWPIDHVYVGDCVYVGDRVIDGAMALYDGLDGAPTCQRGQDITLRLRNPLAVPASVCGVLMGQTYRASQRIALHRPRFDYAADPPPLSAADLERMVRGTAICHACGDDLTGMATWHDNGRTYCKPCYNRRELGWRLVSGPDPGGAETFSTVDAQQSKDAKAEYPMTAKELLHACGDPPGWSEGDVIHTNLLKLMPRLVYYCEAAPPRAVVEAATCLLDGNEIGAPARVPFLTTRLRWTARMQVAWERHEEWKTVWAKLRDVAVARNDRKEMVRLLESHSDWEMTPPLGRDLYNGEVVAAPATGKGARCALCGGWLRAVTL